MTPRLVQESPCRNAAQHTPAPRQYTGWHVWAEEMGRTHDQKRCPVCDLYKIWVRRPEAPDLPPVRYRIGHKECQCCDGEQLGCDCRWHTALQEQLAELERRAAVGGK